VVDRHELLPIGQVDGESAIAADTARGRLDHEPDERRGDHRVHRIATLLEDAHASLGLAHIPAGYDAILGHQLGAAYEKLAPDQRLSPARSRSDLGRTQI
jgi:hypothetical protein